MRLVVVGEHPETPSARLLAKAERTEFAELVGGWLSGIVTVGLKRDHPVNRMRPSGEFLSHRGAMNFHRLAMGICVIFHWPVSVGGRSPSGLRVLDLAVLRRVVHANVWGRIEGCAMGRSAVDGRREGIGE